MDLALVETLNNLTGHSPFFDTFVVFCANYLPWVLVLVTIAWLWNTPFKDQLLIVTAALLSVCTSRYIVTDTIRILYPRPRPFLESPLIQPLFTVQESSLPSGHAALLFAFATALYLFNKRLGFVLYIGATIVVLARVIAGVHYPADILAGALVGMVSAYLVTILIKRKYRSTSK